MTQTSYEIFKRSAQRNIGEAREKIKQYSEFLTHEIEWLRKLERELIELKEKERIENVRQ